MNIENLKRIIDQISRDKGIDRKLLIEAIEEAVKSAARKKYGSRRDIEVQFDDETGEIEVFQYRTVVDEVEDEETEIAIADARLLDPAADLEDDIGEKILDIADLGRIAAQSAKQVIIHRMRDAERDVIFEMFRDRQGSIVNGIVQRFERGNMIINLGRTDAILPRDGQIPKRSFKQGDRIRAYLQEVRQDSRDSPLILSRTSNEFLMKLFEMEVPEIAEGIVRILGASREPGFRAKIAVSSTESDVDPVGACVGMKGSRVQNVVQELQGERIDIVPWSPDPAKYVYNALAPAEVSMVIVDEDNHQLLVVVPDDQLSLAIGRQGQNVRLASKLLSWRIDVKSETRYANLDDSGYKTLVAVVGVDENMADKLFAADLVNAGMLAAAESELIMATVRVDEEKAELLKDNAAVIAASGLLEKLQAADSVEDEDEDEDADSGEDAVTEEDAVVDDVVADSGEDAAAEEDAVVDDVVADSGEDAVAEEDAVVGDVVADSAEDAATEEDAIVDDVVADSGEDAAEEDAIVDDVDADSGEENVGDADVPSGESAEK